MNKVKWLFPIYRSENIVMEEMRPWPGSNFTFQQSFTINIRCLRHLTIFMKRLIQIFYFTPCHDESFLVPLDEAGQTLRWGIVE